MSEAVKKTKPIAGAIWGLLFGLGLALMAIDRRMVSLGIGPVIAFVVLGAVLGVVWAMFGPAKKAKDAPAAEA